MYSIQVYNERNEKIQHLHAPLAHTGQDGVLLTIGRKAHNDIVLQEKSISRDHCLFRVVSTASPSCWPATVLVQGQELSLGSGMPIEPRNEIERKACRNAPHHTIIVLESIGKKGCHVLLEQGQQRSKTETSRHEPQDTDDEATDDDEQEQPSSSSQIPLSQISKQIAKEKELLNPILKPCGSHYILGPFLSNHNPSRRSSISIQCGGLSSLVIEQVEWKIYARGNISLKNDFPIEKADRLFGITLLPQFSMEITHLIADRMESVPKQIAAWAAGKHTVTPDYLLELFIRSKPSDPLPDPLKFQPKTDSQTFWSRKSNPELWSKANFLSIAEDEYETMVSSAGPRIIKLHQMEDHIAIERARSALNEFGPTSCFCVTDSRRKLVADLRKLGVPVFSTRATAKAIIEQKFLETKDGQKIGAVSGYADPLPVAVTEAIRDPEHAPINELPEVAPKSNKRTKPESPEKVHPPKRSKDSRDALGGASAATKNSYPIVAENAATVRRSLNSKDVWCVANVGVKTTMVNTIDVASSEEGMEGSIKAETETRTGILRRGDFLTVTSRDGATARKPNVCRNISDFKRFRKNQYIPQAGPFINFSSVTPEATNGQLVLLQENRELNEQRRRADELFGH